MKILIIGAGVTGLVAAHELEKKGHKTIIVEKESEIGGSLRCIKIGNFWAEQSYHVVFPGQKNTINLIEELGFKDKLKWHIGSTGFYHDELFDATSPTNILRYKHLSLKDRLNIFWSVMKTWSVKDPIEYDKITAKDWITNAYSSDLYDKFYRPMVVCKFGDYADSISATWLISRMALRNKRKWGGEIIGYLHGSFKQVLDELSKDKEIYLNSKVDKININEGRIVSAVINGKEETVDAVISTIPPAELNKIVELPKDYFDKINPPYEDLVCGIYSLKRPLSKHFWINFMDPTCTTKFLLELTSLVPFEEYGQSIVYLGHYTYKNSEMWKKSENEIEKAFTEELKAKFGVKDEDILFKSVGKIQNVCIVSTCDAVKRLREIGHVTPIKNLYVAGMFNCYPTDNVNVMVEKAKDCVNQLVKEREISPKSKQ